MRRQRWRPHRVSSRAHSAASNRHSSPRTRSTLRHCRHRRRHHRHRLPRRRLPTWSPTKIAIERTGGLIGRIAGKTMFAQCGALIALPAWFAAALAVNGRAHTALAWKQPSGNERTPTRSALTWPSQTVDDAGGTAGLRKLRRSATPRRFPPQHRHYSQPRSSPRYRRNH